MITNVPQPVLSFINDSTAQEAPHPRGLITPANPRDVLEAALEAARAGWPVYPVKGKRPALRVKVRASTDPKGEFARGRELLLSDDSHPPGGSVRVDISGLGVTSKSGSHGVPIHNHLANGGDQAGEAVVP